MTTATHQIDSPAEYRARLEASCNGVSFLLWKTTKGLIYAAGFALFGWYAIRNGAPVFETTVAVFIAATIAMVGEVKEVEIANVVTLDFRPRQRRADPAPALQTPERVGTLSEPIGPDCRNLLGETIEELERCGNDATHTVVMRDETGDLTEVPMCTDCDPEVE